jgi:hypothetical protein
LPLGRAKSAEIKVRKTKNTWGGRRPGAGRPKSPDRATTLHRARPALSPQHPVHVVLRAADVGRLRTDRVYRALRLVLARYVARSDFRIVHISIQHDGLHLIVEATGKRALGRGMQSFAINAARAINTARGRSGKVFAHRYDATQITSPREARDVLALVLNRWRGSRDDRPTESVDPYSSGISFDGWRRGTRLAVPAGYLPLPVSPPITSLLRHAWRRLGPLDPFERPRPPS